MIGKLYVIETVSTDPYHNLGLEKYLFDRVPDDACILYIWQNDRTVVIGRNQLAENECNILRIEEDGGHIARRLSGGGAVYHDMGNLNFTFIMKSDDYDEERQTNIVLNTLRACGAQCEKTGRNDITLNGRKLSGHAYYHHNGHSYHHGTIMVDVDIERLTSYLNVSDLKLHDRHVKSVRSRVINLKEANNAVEMNMVRVNLISCFDTEYDLEHTLLCENELNKDELKSDIAFFADRSWVFKDQKHFEISKQRRFNWGILRIDYNLVGNIISDCQVSSDGMNGDYLAEMAMILKGRNITNLDFLVRDSQNSDIAADVIKMLQEE